MPGFSRIGKSNVGVEEIVTTSAEETTAAGRALAARLAAPTLVLLKGDLGTGKTTLAKGIISGLGAASEEEVTSPTFTLVHVFERNGNRKTASERLAGADPSVAAAAKVYHVDLYRIENSHDLESLALEDVLGETEPGIVIVEWSERLSFRSNWPVVRIELDHLGGDQRRIRITGLDSLTA
jgi:tRNA threonylcarbamoyladenosine biosynthesis protein TsaE